jgi:hypothetical protein
MSVIMGATGTISKLFSKYLSNTWGKHEFKYLQTASISCTAHIFRKLRTKVKVQNIQNGK